MVRPPSVCLSHPLTAATAAGGFAAERPAGRRYQSSSAGAVLQALVLSTTGSVALMSDEGSTQTCICVVSCSCVCVMVDELKKAQHRRVFVLCLVPVCV